MASDGEASRLWRILRTTRQMCYDRGYELTEEECNVSLAQFKAEFVDDSGNVRRQQMTFHARPTAEMLKKYTPLPRPGNLDPQPDIGTIHVEFSPAAGVGIKDLKAFAQLLNEKSYHTGIFIAQAAPTSSALKIIPSILPTVMEIFKEEDLLVNISRHELVPKHTLLSPEDKKRLLERYRLKETQLPRIRMDDPMAKYLGLKRGQVVKIIRKSETAGRYASYRWVI
ncbi:DNA-directed RNA polymerases II 24 kDa polypeptide (RNA polymerase II subunit 5) [Teratosphaeriaceae sp. CCFEE 6253]|nr:DNA-directed RNA polymerases II 24 kDa polypeptide (RNA polymerase II subunit 5) [Teratosphaeriaceae sp. CCFEE 6253]